MDASAVPTGLPLVRKSRAQPLKRLARIDRPYGAFRYEADSNLGVRCELRAASCELRAASRPLRQRHHALARDRFAHAVGLDPAEADERVAAALAVQDLDAVALAGLEVEGRRLAGVEIGDVAAVEAAAQARGLIVAADREARAVVVLDHEPVVAGRGRGDPSAQALAVLDAVDAGFRSQDPIDVGRRRLQDVEQRLHL